MNRNELKDLMRLMLMWILFFYWTAVVFADAEELSGTPLTPKLDCENGCELSITDGAYYCPQSHKLQSDNGTYANGNKCDEWGFCDQLCKNIEGDSRCFCSEGYTCQGTDKARCIAKDASLMSLYFAHESAVISMNQKGGDVRIIANTTGAVGLDFHYQKGLLFWLDDDAKVIHIQQLGNNSNSPLTNYEKEIPAPHESWDPAAIAVDWVGDKLYVADAVGQKIDVFEFTKQSYAIVLDSNLTKPSDIGLDPLMGYLFVVDKFKIFRVNMDGTDIRAIVLRVKASGIAVDVISKRIFWCDLLGNIETVNYNGKNRIKIVSGQSVPTPTKLALFENRIFWTDSIGRRIVSVDKFEGNASIQEVYHLVNKSKPKAIKTAHNLVQPPVTNPCGDTNGGCEHMCIVKRIPTGLGYRCACKIGYRLRSDLVSCELVRDFLIYTQQKFVKGKVLDPINESFDDVILPVVSKHARFVALDFDAREDLIYYSNIMAGVTYKMTRNRSVSEIIVPLEGKIIDLSMDWVSKNVYYIDRETINVLSTRDLKYRRTLFYDLAQPRAIVVHPNKGYIFFVEINEPAKLSRAFTDGSNRVTFKNLTLGWPNGLAIDYSTDRLYWCDALLDLVQHSNLDGGDVRSFGSPLIRQPYHINVYKGFVYLTDWRLNAIIRMNKLDGGEEETLIRAPISSRLFSIKVYSEDQQPVDESHPCWHDNGQCQTVCFGLPMNNSKGLMKKCDCSDGEILGEDGKSCKPEACSESLDFACDNHNCISKDLVCDGKDDCLDNTDERNCTSETTSSPTIDCKNGCEASSANDTYYCPKNNNLQPDSSTHVDGNKCDEWGFCDQLCKNIEGDFRCSCAKGYTCQGKDKARCIADDANLLSIYFAHEDGIISMNYQGGDVGLVPNTTGSMGFDFHYKKDLLFSLDNETKVIRIQHLRGNSNSPLSEYETEISPPHASWSPVAIAVDWVGDKLYVADAVGQKIDVFEFTMQSHAIILDTNLIKPSDIGLDPLMGYLFVVDKSQIFRANMDGTDIRAIVPEVTASSIAVDIIGKRIFWCDPLGNIETVYYDGRNRIKILNGQSVRSPIKLALFENRIFWIDSMSKRIVSMDKFEGNASIQEVYHLTNESEPQTIKIAHNLVQPPVTNPCGDTNGGCEHMCIVKRIPSGLGYRCACKIGYRLRSDRKNCTFDSEFLIYSQQKFIKGKVVDPIMASFDDVILPVVSDHAAFTALDFDARDDLIYYADSVADVTYRMDRNRSVGEIILPRENKLIEDLAVDWVSKLLYFVDGRNGTINVLSTKNLKYRRTLLRGLTHPRAIVVHPNKGYIFFSEWHQPTNIIRAFTDGSNRATFNNLKLGWPNGLAIDYGADRLYWCDALLGHVQHSNLDGGDVKTITPRRLELPNHIVVFENFMYVTDWLLQAVAVLDKFQGREEALIKTSKNRLFNVKIYSKAQQAVDESHPCWRDNGQCQELCFGLPTKGSKSLMVKCGCSDGETLGEDGKTCKPIGACSKSSDFACDNQKCISKDLVCDGNDDCLDNSDERNCTTVSTCSSTEFTCENGKCISLTFRCDGADDCHDFSDETNCYNHTCEDYHFRCTNGHCILNSWRCDSHEDCEDGSDERNCEKETCSSDHYTCSETGNCIPKTWKCDGESDCDDGSDEKDCPTCRPRQFQCKNEKCISEDFKCDRDNDCGDNSDEADCPFLPCADTQFRCTDGHCISKSWVCDGDSDCEDGSDESVTDCEKKTCTSDQYTCLEDGRCIPQIWVCDGDGDCLGGDDELDCPPVTCSPNQFQCEDPKRCIPAGYECDGKTDCNDGSDERGCLAPTCSPTEFRCKNGRCIQQRFRCNLENDCGDYSDEEGCPKVTCSSAEFRCTDGGCIPISWRCDSERNCDDGTDEDNCPKKNECAPNFHACAITGGCIPLSWVCDGNDDCYGNDDERDCPPVTCPPNQFKCDNLKQCVRNSYKCDGIRDCNDDSDEKGCPEKGTMNCTTKLTTRENSSELLFQCNSSDVCIPKSRYCDGHADCDDASDEPVTCGSNCSINDYRCKNSKCINKTLICDGKDDCGDGSDEDNVEHACKKPPFKCPFGQWKCSERTEHCVNVSKVCDGKADCPYGEDEGEDCDLDQCKDQGKLCSNCTQTPTGAVCLCPEGETLSEDGFTCKDENECDPPGLCSQLCTNMHGSYFCNCGVGYALDSDKHSCEAYYHEEAFIVISNTTSIFAIATHDQSLERGLIDVGNVTATASDAHKGRIFWFDANLMKITKLDIDIEHGDVISTNLGFVESLAYDWIADNIYWLDSKLKKIEVATEDGSGRITLVKENIMEPKGLSLDPTRRARWLFWTDSGENPRIERIGMDGTNRSVVIDTKIFWPSGLTLDIATRRVYFADSKLDYVEFCNYDGTGRRQLLAKIDGILGPYSLTLFENTLHWLDRRLDAVFSTRKLNGYNQTISFRMVSQPLSIHVSHPSLQPTSSNPCIRQPCQHICLLSPSTTQEFSCKCEHGYKVTPHGYCNRERISEDKDK